MTIKLGVIGASGYWGRKVLKALAELANVQVLACAGRSNWNELVQSPALDAVIVASSTESHAVITHQALEAGKHVFVEKPLCLGTNEAESLARLARDTNKILFVDHTYVFSKSLRFIKEQIETNRLGKIHYFHSNRTQMGIYRLHSALWDLGPHDLSIIKHLFPSEELGSIYAVGQSSFALPDEAGQAVEDSVFFKLSYQSGLSASAFLSWCHPKKARDIVIAGDTKMILFEDNNRVSIFEHELPYRTGLDRTSQWRLVEEKIFSEDNPLKNGLECFLACVNGGLSIPPGAAPAFACEIIANLERIA
jgi:predicted dehydrogenase